MKTSFISKIIVNHQTFCHLLILSFIVKTIAYCRNYCRCQIIVVYRQNHRSSWKLYLLVEILGLSKQYQEFGKPRKLKLKQQQILSCKSVLTTTMECLLILPLNYIQSNNLFLFSFLKSRDVMFFCHINICSVQRTYFKQQVYFHVIFDICSSFIFDICSPRIKTPQFSFYSKLELRSVIQLVN